MENIAKFIVFTLRSQSFGVNVRQVLSIERMQEITPVPKTSEFIKGIINMRGETIPIVDLKERLAIEMTEPATDNRILIVKLDDMQVGFIVDAATDVLDIDEEFIDKAPNIVGDLKDEFIHGVAKLESGLLILLDLASILDFSEANEVKKVETLVQCDE
ncbi:chemotaxis protein CheW [Virgibacillus sp. 179-BFC.A HS]|uniref:Chemotaxis protein CheW n=1 Tax=Tigheibacillus jepli TaxID=3035914 RepID=A0ABU5CN00_9BACI|nr:chemotaxis protein CheW [Virgibacillus sp. 179-BFC.A HS]MDY0406823.1 chemotaxis protein CheW [Virgibacillus sp. 179-BFC.A HS]